MQYHVFRRWVAHTYINIPIIDMTLFVFAANCRRPPLFCAGFHGRCEPQPRVHSLATRIRPLRRHALCARRRRRTLREMLPSRRFWRLPPLARVLSDLERPHGESGHQYISCFLTGSAYGTISTLCIRSDVGFEDTLTTLWVSPGAATGGLPGHPQTPFCSHIISHTYI